MEYLVLILLGVGFIYNGAKALYRTITLSVENQHNLTGTVVDFKSKKMKRSNTYHAIIEYKDPIDQQLKTFKSNLGKPSKPTIGKGVKFTYIQKADGEIVTEENIILTSFVIPCIFVAVGLVLLVVGVVFQDVFALI